MNCYLRHQHPPRLFIPNIYGPCLVTPGLATFALPTQILHKPPHTGHPPQPILLFFVQPVQTPIRFLEPFIQIMRFPVELFLLHPRGGMFPDHALLRSVTVSISACASAIYSDCNAS